MSTPDPTVPVPEGYLLVSPRPVGNLVSRRAVGVELGSSLRAAISMLVDGDFGVIVIRDGERLRGILSERDVLDAVHDGSDLDTTLVDELMQADIISVDPSISVIEAARVMIDRGVRHLIVEGPEGGVVSIRAAMRSLLG